MARTLDAFPEGSGRGSYPWNEWLDGKIWELEAGVDFTVKLDSFKGAALAAARTREGKLRTAKVGDKKLVIQFIPQK
jgi:glycine cleavage system aminomethyltransferase T